MPLSERFKRPQIRAFLNGDLAHSTQIAEKVVASCFVAAAATAMFHIAANLFPLRIALWMALQFSFSTLAFSLVSRALWQHAPSIFLNSLLLLILIKLKHARWAAAAGAVLALAFFTRPTNVIPAFVVGIYLLRRDWKSAALLVAGALPVTAAFISANVAMYGTLLAPYFLPERSNAASLTSGPNVEALLGNLISPGRGLFVYMPFLLLLFAPTVWRHPAADPLRKWRPWLAAIFIGQLLLVSAVEGWWSGFSYGLRYLSDVLPYLMLLWTPALLVVQSSRMFRAVYILLTAISLFINTRGAVSIGVHHWNATPVSVDQDPSRVWDWTDLPFQR